MWGYAGCRVQGACLSVVGYALHIPLQTGILCRVGACLEVMLTADIGNSSLPGFISRLSKISRLSRVSRISRVYRMSLISRVSRIFGTSLISRISRVSRISWLLAAPSARIHIYIGLGPSNHTEKNFEIYILQKVPA